MTESQDYDYRLDPNLSLSAKWKLAVEEKKKAELAGTASAGSLVINKLGPAYFLFVALGGVGWIVFGVLPYKYPDGGVGFVLSEIFVWYIFINVMLNWRLCYVTDSSYSPALEDVELQCPSQESRIRDEPSLEGNPRYPDPGDTSRPGSSSSHSQCNSPPHHAHVAAGVNDNSTEKQKLPYWSWAPCSVCKRARPPRCHHCTLCQRCVLKRDHHCFLSRSCVGAYNQRYFMYYLFWCAWLTNLGNFHLLPYLFTQVLPRCGFWNLIPPLNLLNVFIGHVTVMDLHLILVSWGVLFLTFVSCGMLAFYVYLMVQGMTKFEYDHTIKVEDVRSTEDRVRSVMGASWGYGLLVPGYSVSGPLEDPVHWPSIKLD